MLRVLTIARRLGLIVAALSVAAMGGCLSWGPTRERPEELSESESWIGLRSAIACDFGGVGAATDMVVVPTAAASVGGPSESTSRLLVACDSGAAWLEEGSGSWTLQRAVPFQFDRAAGHGPRRFVLRDIDGDGVPEAVTQRTSNLWSLSAWSTIDGSNLWTHSIERGGGSVDYVAIASGGENRGTYVWYGTLFSNRVLGLNGQGEVAKQENWGDVAGELTIKVIPGALRGEDLIVHGDAEGDRLCVRGSDGRLLAEQSLELGDLGVLWVLSISTRIVTADNIELNIMLSQRGSKTLYSVWRLTPSERGAVDLRLDRFLTRDEMLRAHGAAGLPVAVEGSDSSVRMHGYRRSGPGSSAQLGDSFYVFICEPNGDMLSYTLVPGDERSKRMWWARGMLLPSDSFEVHRSALLAWGQSLHVLTPEVRIVGEPAPRGSIEPKYRRSSDAYLGREK